jgi:hypothetical protein
MPGSVSISMSRNASFCASAKRRICAWANLMSVITWSGRLFISDWISSGRRRNAGGDHLSNFAERSRTASSPRVATSSRMASTVWRTLRSASVFSASVAPCFNIRIIVLPSCGMVLLVRRVPPGSGNLG